VDRCARCTEADNLVALTRYADTETGYATEAVCSGCCTRTEASIGSRITDDPDLLAFVLALVDAFGRLAVAQGVGTQVPTKFDL
jgi:hypothetical protein